MPTMQVHLGIREMRAKISRTTRSVEEAQERAPTISVPKDVIARWEVEIASLPTRKRKNWKRLAKDQFGTKGVVFYDAEGVEVPGYGRVHFMQHMNKQKQAMFNTNQKIRPVLPIGWQHTLPDTMKVVSVRNGSDAAMDSMSPDEQRAHMRAIREANATGNHESRKHPVRVPTKAGEPVRG